MKNTFLVVALLLVAALPRTSFANEADDTTITITAQTAGVTPFISQLTLNTATPSVIKSIQFTITPKPGSVTRPLSGTYGRNYLLQRGYIQPPTIFLPVYGLYDGYKNTVTLTYRFFDGSSKQDTTQITTSTFSDPCGYKNPTVLQARTDATTLSYDFIMIKNSCSAYSPTIIDTDGAVRWVGPAASVPPFDSAFFHNAIYRSDNKTGLYRVDLDGTITFLHDYSNLGITQFHHNIDPGKVGLICDVDTTSQFESVNMEVDAAGNVVKIWNLADIISAAMIAGGDDPSQFVYPTPTDWFHNNGTTYNRADDSIIISSRENFLICLDYQTGAIKWILGDPTKKWYQFPSLRKYALALGPNTLPPIGQHAPSITFDEAIELFDNGFNSSLQMPPGALRPYASPRKYQLNLAAATATEVWNYEMNQSINSPICGSAYEDGPFNYLIDYAFVGGFSASTQYGQLLGLDASDTKIFYYQYPTHNCDEAFNSVPLHLESTSFPSVGPQAVNLSTRGMVGSGENALIGGFIVTGTDNKTVALRVLGPSLATSGVMGTLADPTLTVYNSAGAIVTTNDNWQSDPTTAAALIGDGLAPSDPAEAATEQSFAPGSYTVVASSKDGSSGIGLVEAYDVSRELNSQLANISTRGFVGTGDNTLISGFIIGDVGSATVAIRALGPSLTAVGVTGALPDPILTVYDHNGVAIANNDNWGSDIESTDLKKNGLAPNNAAEAATILNPPAGAYTAIVTGANGGTGVGLIEVYDLK